MISTDLTGKKSWQGMHVGDFHVHDDDLASGGYVAGLVSSVCSGTRVDVCLGQRSADYPRAYVAEFEQQALRLNEAGERLQAAWGIQFFNRRRE